MQDISSRYKTNETSAKKTQEEEINYYNEIISNIGSIFTDNNYNTTNLDNGEEQFIKTEKLTITLTTTQNQKNNLNNINNMTILDLGNCEDDLRGFYNISKDVLLYIKKLDIFQEGMKTSKVEFDIYCKLNGTNLIKLNKSVCENSKISLSIPIGIKEDIDKLNISSDYYNDICYTVTSESGTDICVERPKTRIY